MYSLYHINIQWPEPQTQNLFYEKDHKISSQAELPANLNVPEWMEQSKLNMFNKPEILPLFLKEPGASNSSIILFPSSFNHNRNGK